MKGRKQKLKIFLEKLQEFDGFTRYVLSWHYYELIEKIEKREEKSNLMVNDILNKVLDMIKEITGIDKFDNTEFLIEADDKLPDNITLKNVVILMTCVVTDDGKFYPKLLLKEALLEVQKLVSTFHMLNSTIKIFSVNNTSQVKNE